MGDNSSALKLLNASGYVFQLAVETAVTSRNIRDVEVAAREHPWVHEPTGRSGFIDLVIEKGLIRLVVECKRTTDAHWLFLAPGVADAPVQDFHGLWSMSLDEKVPACEWDRELFSPASPTSEFCCVRGSGEGQVAVIDRIGAELVYATEALAQEERAHRAPSARWEFPIRYMPTIVTNANLAVAKCDPKDVDLASGKIADCEVMQVDLVRYRKALDPLAVNRADRAQSTRDSNRQSQRSVFVVSAAALPRVLTELGTIQDNFRNPPWRVVLERHQGRR